MGNASQVYTDIDLLRRTAEIPAEQADTNQLRKFMVFQNLESADLNNFPEGARFLLYESELGEYMRFLSGVPNGAWFIVDLTNKIVKGKINFDEGQTISIG